MANALLPDVGSANASACNVFSVKHTKKAVDTSRQFLVVRGKKSGKATSIFI